MVCVSISLDTLRASLRINRTITIALTMGAIVFAIIAVQIRFFTDVPAPQTDAATFFRQPFGTALVTAFFFIGMSISLVVATTRVCGALIAFQ